MGWSWQALSLRKRTKWCGVNVGSMGDQLKNSKMTVFEPFLWATPAKDGYKITGGRSTSAVTWEVRAGEEWPLRIKTYELMVLLSLRILSFLSNTEGLIPLKVWHSCGDHGSSPLSLRQTGQRYGTWQYPFTPRYFEGALGNLTHLYLRGQILPLLEQWKRYSASILPWLLGLPS